MASNQWIFAFAALCAVTLALDQDNAPLYRPWVKDAYDEDKPESDLLAESKVFAIKWVACDYNGFPSFTCINCNTKVTCLPIGGIQRTCSNSRRPYCNNGFCSATPPANC